MHIVLACATNRGRVFLEKLIEMLPRDSNLTVFSFREESWEPPFLDAIQSLTLSNQGQFFESKKIDAGRWSSFWETTTIDLMLIVSWRYMIPPSIYTRPRFGTFIFHDSLLPAYRGFSPTVWAMINGEDHTGVTLFQVREEVDSGPIVDQISVQIGPDETIRKVVDRVTLTYLAILERNWNALINGIAVVTDQDHSRATFTCKRLPEDNLINWSLATKNIYNLIRATTMPYTGAYTYLNGQKLRVWEAQKLALPRHYVGRIPGRVIDILFGVGSIVLTGDGALLLTLIQLDDAKPVCAANILNSLNQTLG